LEFENEKVMLSVIPAQVELNLLMRTYRGVSHAAGEDRAVSHVRSGATEGDGYA
jgi:hypothetical protein